MEKSVDLIDKKDFIIKLLNVFNAVNDITFKKSEILLLTELMYGYKNRLNQKTKEATLLKLIEKGVYDEHEGKVKDFLFKLFDQIDNGEFKYTISFKIKSDDI